MNAIILRNYLFQMYCAPENKLLLVFLKIILNELNQVNKLFEHDLVNPVKLYDVVLKLHQTLMGKVIRPTSIKNGLAMLSVNVADRNNHLPIEAMNCGIEFNFNLKHLPKANEIKVRCFNYVIELLRQMQQRFPENINEYQNCMKDKDCVVCVDVWVVLLCFVQSTREIWCTCILVPMSMLAG